MLPDFPARVTGMFERDEERGWLSNCSDLGSASRNCLGYAGTGVRHNMVRGDPKVAQ